MSHDGTDSQNWSTPEQKQSALHAERGVLGACLLGGRGAVEEALELQLRDVDFARQQHAEIWRAMVRLTDRGDVVDTVTVVDELVARKALDNAGGAAAVSQLEAMLPTVAHLVGYARVVMETAALRRIAEAAALIQRAAVERDAPAAELLARASELFFSLERRQQRSEVVDRAAVVREVMARIGQASVRGLPTGWRDLDRGDGYVAGRGDLGLLRRGMQPGNLILVGARPSMGKTVFGHNVASNVADEGVHTAFFSLEMTPHELIEREIAGAARLGSDHWAAAMHTGRMQHAAGVVAERPMHVVHCPGSNIGRVSTLARRLVARQGVGLIVVDYLGLVAGSGDYRGQRTQEVGEVSRGLKSLAGELMIPIVALSQLNRGVESRNTKRPTLSDLRDSGELEQDADVVCFLHRPEYYLKEQTPLEDKGVCEVIVEKQRNGPTGVCRLFFQREQTRFRDLAENTGPERGDDDGGERW